MRCYLDQFKWWPSLFLLMPDHLHMLVGFGRGNDIVKVITGWKRYVARANGITWQRGFFEHRLRTKESMSSKAAYILHNPARAGLITEGEIWPFMFMPTHDPSREAASSQR